MSELWADSLALMLLGMGTVFVFLTILVIATTVMSSIVARIPVKEETPIPSSVPFVASDDEQELAVAAAAAFHFSKQQTR